MRKEQAALVDQPQDVSRTVQGHLAEILTMALIEKGLIDCETICAELESLASARRGEGHGDVAAGLAGLAVSLRAVRQE